MKNKKLIKIILSGFGLAILITALPFAVSAQEGRYANVYSKNTVSGYVNQLEKSSNTFRRDFDRYMDRSSLNGTATEDRYNGYVKDYERSLNTLKRQFQGYNTWWESRSNVRDMIEKAQPVNTMMNTLPFARNLEVQWRNMRNDINKVADTYDLPGLNGGGWSGGGGGWGGGGGGWGGGAQISPPSWAIGTFYGRDNVGRQITVTIDRNGNVSASADGTPFSGSFIRGNLLSFQDGTSRVTREGNGFWTTRTSNGERTFFSPNWNGGGGGGGGIGVGNRVRPPSWAVGTFYGRDSAGRNVTLIISGEGFVSANADGLPFSGNYIKGDYLSFDDGTSRVTREGNGFWTTRSSNGERTYFRR
jgi:hypothetical protein